MVVSIAAVAQKSARNSGQLVISSPSPGQRETVAGNIGFEGDGGSG